MNFIKAGLRNSAENITCILSFNNKYCLNFIYNVSVIPLLTGTQHSNGANVTNIH